ncbi:MAG: hypothetical protein ACO3F3_15250 [Gemmataceae bacterium]
MARPCNCDNVIPNSTWDETQCRLCWFYHHNDRVRKAWDSNASVEMPSTGEQVGSFVSSAAKWAFSGCKRVPLEVHQERMRTCVECEFIKDENRCGVCGCFIKTKTSWVTEKCPVGKWSFYESPGNTPG